MVNQIDKGKAHSHMVAHLEVQEHFFHILIIKHRMEFFLIKKILVEVEVKSACRFGSLFHCIFQSS